MTSDHIVQRGLALHTTTLTHAGALRVLEGAVAKAKEIGVPQCIAVVDPGGNLLAFVRMDGAKVLSQISATQKAITAASSRAATGGTPDDLALKLALATDGRVTNLKGGLPITVDGHCLGAVGVGSGTGDQDVEVGQAGIAALERA
jgi:glc operon protein GlcG